MSLPAGLQARWSRLAPRDRKMLAVMAGAMVLFCLVQWVVFPLLDRTESNGGSGGPTDELARMKGWIEAAPSLERETRGFEALAAAQRARLLPASNPQLASAALQRTVEKLAERFEAEVRSVQLGEPKAAGERFLRVPMSLEMHGPLGKLMPLLHAIETNAQPALVVEKMEFRRGSPQSPDDYLMRLELLALHVPDTEHKKTEKSLK